MKTILTSKKIQLLVIVLLTILAYSNIFQNGFVIDDFVFIDKNFISKVNIFSAFQGVVPPGHEGVYRPIRSVFYLLYSQLFGQNPFWWHLHSLFVHLASTVLVYLVIQELVMSNLKIVMKKSQLPIPNYQLLLPFFVSLLFGLHPIHTEAVTYIAASMDTTGIVFMLTSFYFYLSCCHPERSEGSSKKKILRLRLRMTLSVISALFAFFTYEMTLTLPLLIVLYEVTLGKKDSSLTLRMTKRIWAYFLLAGVYGFIRFFLIHATTRGPYLANSVYLTFLTMIKVYIKYISLLFFPIGLANNHAISKGIEAFVYRGYKTEAIVRQSVLDIDILLYILMLIGIVWVGIYFWKRKPIISFCIFWFFISLVPVSEIIPQGAMLNERSLYIPSLGFILIEVLLLVQVVTYLVMKVQSSKFKVQNNSPRGEAGNSKSKTFNFKLQFLTFHFAFLILLAFYGYKTFTRNLDWRDGIIFWTKDIQRYPTENAYAYFQLGNAYSVNQNPEKAIQNYKKAFEINPHFAVAIASAARLYDQRRRDEEAAKLYEKAVEADQYFWEGWFYLGNISFSKNNLDEAENYYERALAINPAFQTAKNNLQVVIARLLDQKKKFSNSWISFQYPQNWIILQKNNQIILTNTTSTFQIEFSSAIDQTRIFGELKNKGLAQIPNFDEASVKEWNNNGVAMYQFFLTKGKKTIQIIVSPSNSALMKVFDGIVSSIEILEK